MKFIIAFSIAASLVSAHSWIECTNHDNSQMLGWMKGNSTLNPPVIIDPAMPWYSSFCHGWPRNKNNPGNWIDESSNYSWNLAAKSFTGDTHACHPTQRAPTYKANATMSTAAAGGMIRLRYGGNGHARGYSVGGDPGTVTVYWKGKPEAEITDSSEFTKENALQSQGFAANSFAYPADPSITSPVQGLVDKGNWMELNLPKTMAPGRHMMAWVWYFKNPQGVVQAQWSTCFDVMISGTASGGSPAPAAPAAPVAPDAAVVVPSAAPSAPVPVPTPAPATAPTTTPAPASEGCDPVVMNDRVMPYHQDNMHQRSHPRAFAS